MGSLISAFTRSGKSEMVKCLSSWSDERVGDFRIADCGELDWCRGVAVIAAHQSNYRGRIVERTLQFFGRSHCALVTGDTTQSAVSASGRGLPVMVMTLVTQPVTGYCNGF